ncbi:hypothetical protein J7E63_28720 [Bacillus sp. ISL-75]|nr:hypothetical protein [Bacillus sp. ISL-75]
MSLKCVQRLMAMQRSALSKMEKVEGEEQITLIFLLGEYYLTGEKLFYYNFGRQFTIEEDGHIYRS